MNIDWLAFSPLVALLLNIFSSFVALLLNIFSSLISLLLNIFWNMKAFVPLGYLLPRVVKFVEVYERNEPLYG